MAYIYIWHSHVNSSPWMPVYSHKHTKHTHICTGTYICNKFFVNPLIFKVYAHITDGKDNC